MRKLIVLLVLLMTTCSTLWAQNQQINANRVSINDSLSLSRRWVKRIATDTAGVSLGDSNVLATMRVVKQILAGGTGGSDGNNYPTGTSFNTATGILQVTRSGLGPLNADLNGRFIDEFLYINDSVVEARKNGLAVFRDTLKSFVFTGSLQALNPWSASLVNDQVNPGPDKVYATDVSGVKVWRSFLLKMLQVSSYSALRALPTGELDVNATYVVRTNNINGSFRYDPADVTSADDSVMVIVTGGGKRLKRITDGVINARWFVTPDDEIDDSWGFQKMWNFIDTVAKSNNLDVIIPAGKYNQNQSVNLPQVISTPGNGSIPRITVSGYGAIIFITGGITAWKRTVANITEAGNAINAYHLTIKGIEFSGDGSPGQKGMDIHSMYSGVFEDLRFTLCDTGFVARFILGSQFNNILYTNNVSTGLLGGSLAGVAAGCDASNSAFNANVVYKNRVYCGNGSYTGMTFLAADGCYFLGNIIEGSKPRYSFYFDSQESSVVNGNHIKTMWFESNGGVYANNVAMRLRINGVFTIDGIQNDYADTLIDWTGSAGGADISLDNVEYWNFSGSKWIKGTPASGMVFRIGKIYGTSTENFFDPNKYVNGMPEDTYTLYGYQIPSGNGYGIIANTYITLKPNYNAPIGNKNVNIYGNIRFPAHNTYEIGSGANRAAYVYTQKLLAGLASEDGTGASVQAFGSISLGDGQRVTNPDGSARMQFSSNGLNIQFLSGTYATLGLNPDFSYTHGGLERMRMTTAGRFILDPAGVGTTNSRTLQVRSGGAYISGSLELIGIPSAVAADTRVLTRGASDSTTSQSQLKTINGNSLFGSGDIAVPATSLTVISDADYTVAAGISHVVYSSMTAGRTVTLPAASSNTNRMITITNGGNGAFNITTSVAMRQNSTTTTTTVAQSKFVTVVSNGTDWYIVAYN